MSSRSRSAMVVQGLTVFVVLFGILFVALQWVLSRKHSRSDHSLD